MTDIKVPKRSRESVVVLAKDSTVYALPQYEIADAVKIDEDTKNVAYIAIVPKSTNN